MYFRSYSDSHFHFHFDRLLSPFLFLLFVKLKVNEMMISIRLRILRIGIPRII